MKKVVMITPSLGMGGMERVLVNYANLFVNNGYQVTVLNLTYHDQSILSGLDKRVEYKSYYTPIKHVLKCKFKEILRGKFRFASLVKWVKRKKASILYKHYVKDNYDVEIAFFGGVAAKIISGSNNIKASKFVWVHSANIQGLINEVGGEKQFKEIYNSVENVICVSKDIKNKLSGIIDEKRLKVINNPHDTKKVIRLASEPAHLKEQGYNLINVSRIDDKSKGFIRLLGVCKKLNEDGLSYNLWIVGDGADLPMVKQKAKELELSNVHFLGQQENPYKYLQVADIYVCSSYYEGFSMTMVEAGILGKPIVTTAVSGASEILEDGKYGMVVDNSAEGLYEGLKNILSDEKLYKHYVEMAEQRKNFFDEKKILKQFEQLLCEGKV